MMERLDWYIVLKRFFIAAKEDEAVKKPKMLQKLAENYLNLQLKPIKEYFETSSVQGFLYDDVWTLIESMPSSFSWDELLNSLQSLNSASTMQQPNNSIAKTEIKPDDSGRLKVDFPIVKFCNLTEIVMNKNLKFLSLGGNLISNANFEFPSSLVVLNLSFNQISDFLPIRPLVNLKFLNLSNNIIENLQDITGIITIQELFISDNKLNQANFLFSIKNLTLLDLGNNNIENFEDIALLCTSSKLQTLNLSGNPLSTKPNYKSSVNSVVPSLNNFDPTNPHQFSSYKSIGFSEVPNYSSSSSKKLNLINLSPVNQVSVFNMEYSNKAGKWQGGRSSPKLINRSPSPKTVTSSPAKHRRSKSNMPNNSLPTTPSLNNSRMEGGNVRNKNYYEKIGQAKSRLKEFGDPVAALMVGPPAALNIFRNKRSKTMKVDTVGSI